MECGNENKWIVALKAAQTTMDMGVLNISDKGSDRRNKNKRGRKIWVGRN